MRSAHRYWPSSEQIGDEALDLVEPVDEAAVWRAHRGHAQRSDAHRANQSRIVFDLWARVMSMTMRMPLTTVAEARWHLHALQALPAPRRRCDGERWTGHQQSFPCSRLNPSSPANFSLDVQDRMGGCASPVMSHFRLELVHLRAEGVAARRASDRVCSRVRTLKRLLLHAKNLRHSVRWVHVQTLAAKSAGPPRRAACSSLPPPEILKSILAAVELAASSAWPHPVASTARSPSPAPSSACSSGSHHEASLRASYGSPRPQRRHRCTVDDRSGSRLRARPYAAPQTGCATSWRCDC